MSRRGLDHIEALGTGIVATCGLVLVGFIVAGVILSAEARLAVGFVAGGLVVAYLVGLLIQAVQRGR